MPTAAVATADILPLVNDVCIVSKQFPIFQLWTIQFPFRGDSDLFLELYDVHQEQNHRILSKENPNIQI